MYGAFGYGQGYYAQASLGGLVILIVAPKEIINLEVNFRRTVMMTMNIQRTVQMDVNIRRRVDVESER